jgi:hypothetical protein
VPDKAVISHRGEKYEIGRGKRFYGIWVTGAPYEAPVDRWPENRDGWHQAWSRFASMEPPGTIAAVERDRKAPLSGLRLRERLRLRSPGGVLLAGEALLVLGVVLGLVGLFPGYAGGPSLLSQWDQVVPHLAYIIGWALAAAFIALSVARPSNAARLGALFGLGLSALTAGLFLSDVGQVTGGGSFGSGLVISLAGWLTCTVGSALALAAGRPQQADPGPASTGFTDTGLTDPGLANPGLANPGLAGQPSRPVRPTRAHLGPLALLVLAAIGTAAAFIPSWDRYVLTSTTGSQTVTAGNAFDNGALVIAGNVVVIVALIAVAALAALWRPAKQGAWLLAGAIVPMAAEAVSALIQVGQGATASTFGISSAEAAAVGLRISSGLTGMFWVFFVFVISLIVSCAWLFTEPEHPVMSGFAASPWLPAGEAGGVAETGRPVTDDDLENAESEDRVSADADSGPGDNARTDSSATDSSSETSGGGQSPYV